MGQCSVGEKSSAAKAQQHDRKHIKACQPTWDQTWQSMHGGGLQKQGCKSGEVKNYLCKAHGAYGVCTALLCAVVAVNKTGYCTKHGALGWCPVAGCNNAIRARGRCHTHGGGSARTRVCDWEGCTTFAEARRRCAKHGAHGMCAYGECAILNKEMFA
eukprot:gene12247-2663_t